MKPQGIFGTLGVAAMIVLVTTVLFVLASGNSVPATAGYCSYLDYLWYQAHPSTPMPPECAVWAPSTTNTSTTATTPGEDREPPPSTGPVPIGAQGGTVDLGNNIQVSIPPGLLPPGSTVTLTRYPPNSVPTGDAGVAFQGPGDNRVGVLIKDANGNTIQSVPPPGITVHLSTTDTAFSQHPMGVEAWNGSEWQWNPGTRFSGSNIVVATATYAWASVEGGTRFVPVIGGKPLLP